MHNLDLIMTLTLGLAAALAFGYATQRLGLSPIVGYLLAGIAVGPNTPGIEIDRGLAEQTAEIGVILLMFGVGLQFHFEELLAVRRVAIPGAIGQSALATGLGMAAGFLFGWDWPAGLIFGLAISVASTVVLVRVLVDNNDLHTPTGHIAVGWLVVEDLFTVVVLVLLPAIFGKQEDESTNTAVALGIALLKIGVLILVVIFAGGRIIPWLLTKVASTRSRELFTLTILVVALGIAVGSATLFGVSMALGAFLAGMVVGRSDFSLRAASDALPMRDAFAVLFFVSVGMLFDPRFLLESPWMAATALAIVMLGKPLAAVVIVLLLRYPVRIAFAVAVALAQIGEFSFILATLGNERNLNLLPKDGANALVAAAIASISLNPLLYRLVDPLEAWAAQRPRLWYWLNFRAPDAVPTSALSPLAVVHRAVIIGFGPVGKTLARLLQENEVEPTIIEMDLERVQKLRADGVVAVYGDANHLETLKSAGVENAVSLILSASAIRNPEEIIRLVRELNPSIRILVRCTYMRERTGLMKAGADGVFAGEAEVALAMTDYVLRDLGATPEQIDRERDRVHSSLSDERH